jgi:photosystem II stability/assembly factor-like uncharacterized protein
MAPDPTRNVLRRRNPRRLRADGAVQVLQKERVRAVDRPGVLSLAGRLSVGALGLSLALIVSIAWGTALFYLAARLGVDTRVRLSWIDAAHVYVGLVGGVFILAKMSRVRFRYKVAGVAEVVPWQRWISWSLLILYSAIFVSGGLALLPIHGRLYEDLLNFHLLTSVWALAPTTWHVWHYRRRAAPYLTRLLPRGRTLRYWAGVSLAVIPALAVVANARALSQLPQIMGGSSWSQAALNGSYLDRIVTGPNGSLIAAGDALYLSSDGTVWTQIDIPGVPLPPSASPTPGVHQHGAPTGKNLGLSVAVVGNVIYVGTSNGLYRTDTTTGPLVQVAFAGKSVTAVAVDPSDPRSAWAGTSSGLMHSSDGGTVWSASGAGLSKPDAVSVISFAGGRAEGRIFVSDSTGVFAWNASQSWQRLSSMPDVVDLSASRDGSLLYATSTTQGVEILENGAWRPTDSLASPHQAHHGNEKHPEVLSLAPIDGRLYAVGTSFGVSASADQGQTWSQLGGGLENVTAAQLVDYQHSLLAATSNGVYRFPLTRGQPATPTWWLIIVAAVVVCGSAGVVVAGLDRLPKVRAPRVGRRRGGSRRSRRHVDLAG